MAAPTPPTGVTQGEIDFMFSQLRIAGENMKQEWMRARVPAHLMPAWEYGITNPANQSLVVTAVGVVNANSNVAILILCNTPGTGALTLNNAPTTGGANAGNQIFSATGADFTAGQSVRFDVPCDKGLVVSAFPAGGNYTVVYSLTPAG